MKISRQHLKKLLESVILETDTPESDRDSEIDAYGEDAVGLVFASADLDWSEPGDSGSSILRKVGPNALKDLAEFIKDNDAWARWYEREYSKHLGTP